MAVLTLCQQLFPYADYFFLHIHFLEDNQISYKKLIILG